MNATCSCEFSSLRLLTFDLASRPRCLLAGALARKWGGGAIDTVMNPVLSPINIVSGMSAKSDSTLGCRLIISIIVMLLQRQLYRFHSCMDDAEQLGSRFEKYVCSSCPT